jgi:hypothetical protein
MSAAEHQRAYAVAPTMREKIRTGGRPPTPPPRPPTNATILPFPSQRQQRVISRELASVQNYNDFAAWKWLTSVVRRHRTRLKNLGVNPKLIEADTAALQEAFGLVPAIREDLVHIIDHMMLNDDAG